MSRRLQSRRASRRGEPGTENNTLLLITSKITLLAQEGWNEPAIFAARDHDVDSYFLANFR